MHALKLQLPRNEAEARIHELRWSSHVRTFQQNSYTTVPDVASAQVRLRFPAPLYHQPVVSVLKYVERNNRMGRVNSHVLENNQDSADRAGPSA